MDIHPSFSACHGAGYSGEGFGLAWGNGQACCECKQDFRPCAPPQQIGYWAHPFQKGGRGGGDLDHDSDDTLHDFGEGAEIEKHLPGNTIKPSEKTGNLQSIADVRLRLRRVCVSERVDAMQRCPHSLHQGRVQGGSRLCRDLVLRRHNVLQ